MPLTVGTAGHIDHGKTWLVRALTGVDTDRLPEERARGISIDLGYAPLDLPDGRRLSLVDVPGHERFVRTMVAGATGIDLFLLVVDAAEGARPQTLEHLAVLRLLGIETGVVAVTKIDAVDEETVELALAEAAELAPEAVAVPVSARTGAGLDRLLAELAAAADRVERQPAGAATRLYVDRVFTLRGIGTVATGTLWAGSVGEGDVLRAEPAGLDVKVRSVQVHDRPVERAEAGQRVAVAVPGVDRARLRRGDALFEPGAYGLSYRIDVRLDELEPLRDGLRLHVHHGTADTPARLVRSGEAWAQLRLAVPIVAARGDRVVLRAGRTVGGGVVLDPVPPRALDPVRLGLLERGDPQSLVRALVDEPVTRASLERRGLLREQELLEGLDAVERAGDWYFSAEWLARLRAGVRERLRARAEQEPLDPGISIGELFGRAPWAGTLMPLLEVERRGPKVYLPGVAAKLGERTAAAGELERALSAAGPNPIKIDDRNLAAYLEGEGRLIRVGDGLALGAEAYQQGRRVLVEECERGGGRITLARFRDLTGSSRRSAQLVLERFDADGLTRRIGDERVLRRAARGTIEG